MRLFINDNRISTAVKTKSGVLLQVYPAKTTFVDEVAWQKHWEEATKPKIVLRMSYTEDKEAAAPAPKRSGTDKSNVGPAPKKVSLKDWTVKNQRNFTFTVPAGTYYIGDLCYALGDDVYDNIFGGTGYEPGIYEEKGSSRVFLVSRTAWGDGEYKGSDGNKFGVDAAIIGICSQNLMEKSGRGGHVYTFESPVTCRFVCGRFDFEWTSGWYYNSLQINTE